MAHEVIDLISSSPPPSTSGIDTRKATDKGKSVERTRCLNSQDATAGGLQITSTNKTGPTADVNTNSKLPPDDFFFLSDDFDTTIDLDEPILADTNGNKRRRLSPPEKDTRPFKRSASGPAGQSARPTAIASDKETRKRSFDPIEFSSSLDPAIGGHDRAVHDKNRVAASSTNCNEKHIEIIDDEEDPFASSPLPTSRPLPPPSTKTQHVEFSDPFASSPQHVDLTSRSRQEARKDEAGSFYQRKASPRRQNWDPISSSAPLGCSFDSSPPMSKKSANNSIVIDIGDSDSDLGSDDELPDIADFDIAKCKVRTFRRTQSETITSKSRPKTSKAAPKKLLEERTRDKEARAAAKEVEKENKRREKQEAKEAKAREKERNAALAELNKLRTDKKVSTPEMMVDISSSLNSTITTQLEATLEGLDVQFTSWDSPVENVIKWRRKVRSRFNEDLGLWEPIPLRLEDEQHVLVVITATEFVNRLVAEDLDSHIDDMREHFRNHQIIYLIEGLIPWMRKNRNIRNRQFTSGVRSQEPSTQTQNRRRKNNATEGYVPEELIEDGLLQLQVVHDVLIHHTTIPLETAQWIAIFTQHVSTIPYRKQKDQATLGAGFCMESGQVRTGDDAQDTYVRMLQEIVRVTAPIAYGIASEFHTVTDLVNGFEKGGPTILEGVRKSANKDGAFSDRTVGQAVSRRMHKVFTGRDESSTDV